MSTTTTTTTITLNNTDGRIPVTLSRARSIATRIHQSKQYCWRMDKVYRTHTHTDKPYICNVIRSLLSLPRRRRSYCVHTHTKTLSDVIIIAHQKKTNERKKMLFANGFYALNSSVAFGYREYIYMVDIPIWIWRSQAESTER